MTFFYLQGFQKQNTNSLFKLYDIMEISKPQIVFKFIQVALDISKDDYEQNYIPITKHPKFNDIMKKVNYHMKMKSNDLEKMSGKFFIKKLRPKIWNIFI